MDRNGVAASLEIVRRDIVDWTPSEESEFLELEDDPLPSELPSYRDVALLLLSGGTTGTPKLIPRLHAEYAYMLAEPRNYVD